ncbi:hypothetical protein Hanom_Chr10g00872451 [Helianthus anomalus]
MTHASIIRLHILPKYPAQVGSRNPYIETAQRVTNYLSISLSSIFCIMVIKRLVNFFVELGRSNEDTHLLPQMWSKEDKSKHKRTGLWNFSIEK